MQSGLSLGVNDRQSEGPVGIQGAVTFLQPILSDPAELSTAGMGVLGFWVVQLWGDGG